MILELSIGDTCIVKGGKRLPNGHQLLQSKTKHPYIRTRDLNDHKINFNEIECITPETHKEIERYIVDKGNLIISIVGTIGSCAIIPDNLDKANLTENCAKIVPKDSSVDTNFLYYYLISKIGQNEIHKNTVGSTQLKLPLYGIKNIKIPSIDEKSQSRIADFLSNLDKKIELNKKQNETLEEIAKTLFKSWFVDFDPVRAKVEGRSTGLSKEISDLFPNSFEESELGEIPKGWKVENIGNSFEVLLGGTPSRKKEEYWEGDIPWINSGEINNFRILKPSEFISENGFKNSSTKLLPKRSTLIAITGATLGQLSLNEIEVCANQSVIGIPPSKKFPSEYVYLWISSTIQKLISSQTGGAQQHINTNNVKEHLILLPPEKCSNFLKDLLTPVFDKILNNLLQIRALSEIRDTLLPRLISGELKISDAESIINKAGI